LLPLALRKDGGAVLGAGTSELKRLDDGDVAVLHVLGGTGEDGERLIFDTEDERESMGWNDCEGFIQKAAISWEKVIMSEWNLWESGVKV
jgi:hypothetical protein